MSKNENTQQANEEHIPTVEESVSEETQNAEDAVEKDLDALLAEANKEIEAQKELALRTLADMENLKRRTRIDVENAHKFALEKFVDALIPVLDSMEMGMAAANNEEATLESIREGIEITFKQTLDVLSTFNVERINPEGEKFDPQSHEALTMVPSPDHESNTVMDVVQKGYSLNDRLVRPARVVVAQ
ncbi:MAG: nucleotide exchange factor GrpE [Hydrogenovibrio sp.]|nr:nucleotide exchange factor GrpE [Hydrogenovibrio sp.]